MRCINTLILSCDGHKIICFVGDHGQKNIKWIDSSYLEAFLGVSFIKAPLRYGFCLPSRSRYTTHEVDKVEDCLAPGWIWDDLEH